MPNKRKNFKDVLYELADSSSLHGVSKITSSRHLPVKILWCILFLVAFALLVRQMVDLFSTFYSHPIQTSISINYGPLKMPAVTICNMNAIRLSALSLSPKLDIMATLYVGPLTHTVKLENINLAPSLAPSLNTSINETLASQTNPPVLAENSSSGQPFISPTPLQDLQETSEINPYSSTTSSSSDISDTDIELQNEVRESMLEKLKILDAPLKKKILAKRDKWSDRIMKMMRYLKQENETTKQLMGHQSNIIQSVSFAGAVQNVTTTLKRFSDPEFGNCYTLSDPENFVALRSGPGHGLKITLNVEIDEYVDSFITSPGIKVVLHAPGSLPLPSEEGIMLNPATQTNVGLKMVSINRLGQPYGECTEGLEFERKYKIKYSVPACLALCRTKRIIDLCKCIPGDSPNIELNTTILPVCDTSKTSENNICVKKQDILFNDDHVACHCENSCSEIMYSTTMSSRKWPGVNYLYELMEDVCQDHKLLHSMSTPCAQLETGKVDLESMENSERHGLYILWIIQNNSINAVYIDATELAKDFCTKYGVMVYPIGRLENLALKYSQNFLQVLVYFDDLNYESITQEPMYEHVRFLSDIGGAFGLFLGASVLSFVEFLQLLMEICLYLYHEGKAKVGSKVSDVMMAQKVIAAFKSKAADTNTRTDVSS